MDWTLNPIKQVFRPDGIMKLVSNWYTIKYALNMLLYQLLATNPCKYTKS